MFNSVICLDFSSFNYITYASVFLFLIYIENSLGNFLRFQKDFNTKNCRESVGLRIEYFQDGQWWRSGCIEKCKTVTEKLGCLETLTQIRIMYKEIVYYFPFYLWKMFGQSLLNWNPFLCDNRVEAVDIEIPWHFILWKVLMGGLFGSTQFSKAI